MESKVITITPEMAKEMLEKNMKNNRRMSREIIARYARIMRAGGWNLTHQGIAFDTNGELIDGQHRLNAIIQANVPVTMMVTYGVERIDGEAFTIDAGRKRTTLNIMQISGIEDEVYRNVCPYIASYMRWKRPGKHSAESAEIIAYIDRHYDDLALLNEIVRRSGSTKRIPTLVGAAILGALYRGEKPDALHKFCEVYKRNDVSGCADYNPRHALNIREYVRDHRDSGETLARIESAIYSFANNRSVLKVRDNCYPYNAAMDA